MSYRLLAVLGFVFFGVFAQWASEIAPAARTALDVMLTFYVFVLSMCAVLVCVVAFFIPRTWLLRPLIRTLAVGVGLVFALYGVMGLIDIPGFWRAMGTFPAHWTALMAGYLMTAYVLFRIAWNWKKAQVA